MHQTLRDLYHSQSHKAHVFRYILLAFDLATAIFVIVTSFFPHTFAIQMIDIAVGLVIVADFLARFSIDTRKVQFWYRPTNLADLVSIVSFLAPIAGEGLGFLRVVRTLRLLHTYQTMSRLKEDFRIFRHHQEIVVATINLVVFLFVMTGLIYATQVNVNDEIQNYADALYFTVTTLTTTGFGDIVPHGAWGRMLSVVIMIFGVTLFLRLAQVLFRPTKVRCECAECGLALHDADAVHCKHCGTTIHIDTEGQL